MECKARTDIPHPEELFARLIVLLHNPLAGEQLATQILTGLQVLSMKIKEQIYVLVHQLQNLQDPESSDETEDADAWNSGSD